MKKKLIVLGFIAGLLIAFSVGFTQAQSSYIPPGTVLIYAKSVNQITAYVRRTADSADRYTIPDGNCANLSPNGYHIATTSFESDDLEIWRLYDQQIIIHTPWQSAWDPCAVFWQNDTVLSIGDVHDAHVFHEFDVSSGTLTPIDYQPPPRPQYPSLPDWLPKTESNFILPSPESGVYLYERCIDSVTDPTGEICLSDFDYVIYDLNRQEILHVLVEPDSTAIRGIDPFGRIVASSAARWSATGRYLAYRPAPEGRFQFWRFHVYDKQEDRYLNTEFYNYKIDQLKTMQWSPQDNKLLLLIEGRFGGSEVGDDDYRLRTLVIYDAETETFVVSDQPYNFPIGFYGSIGVWSPDGTGYAFIDETNTLLYMDSSTGVTTVIDTNVRYISAWRDDDPSPSNAKQGDR